MSDSTYRLIMKAVGFDKADQKTKKVSGSLKNLAASAAKAASAYLGARMLVDAVRQSVKAYGIQEQAVKRLDQAMGGNSKSLQAYASQLQAVTRFGDETTLGQMAFLGSIGMTEKQIKQIIPVAMDLATATGQTLEFAVRNTAKTYSGLAGELGELVPQIRELTAEEMKQGKAVEVMGELFAGQAKSDAESFNGSIEQMTNSLGDLAEQVGSYIAPAIQGFADALVDITSVSVADQLGADKEAMDDLFEVASDFNATQEVRKDAIDAINNSFGSYLPALLTEESTLQDIEKAHKSIGTAMLKNIAIEVNKAKIAENMAKQNELRKQEPKLINQAKDAENAYIQALDKEKTEREKLNEVHIEGITNTSRHKDDMAEFETALASNVDAYTALGYAVSNTRYEYSEATALLEENRLAQQEIIANNTELISQGEELAESYVNTEDTGSSSNNALEQKVGLYKKLKKEMKDYFTAEETGRKHASKGELEATALSAQSAKEGALSVIQAEISKATARLISSMLQSVPYPLNLVLAATAGGTINALMSEAVAKNLAEGYDGVVTSPTLFRAGEQGAERVQVTNLTKSDGGINSPGGSSNIVINAEVATEEFLDKVIDYIDNKQSMNLA